MTGPLSREQQLAALRHEFADNLREAADFIEKIPAEATNQQWFEEVCVTLKVHGAAPSSILDLFLDDDR